MKNTPEIKLDSASMDPVRFEEWVCSEVRRLVEGHESPAKVYARTLEEVTRHLLYSLEVLFPIARFAANREEHPLAIKIGLLRKQVQEAATLASDHLQG